MRLWPLAVVLFFDAACGAKSLCGPSSAKVMRVIDGDTVELEGGERIRYLLVDTPETTSGKNDCYGAEAVAYNRAQVEGQTVSIAYDEESCRDHFGRLLAYVSVSGKEVNRGLVENGLACVLYIAPGGKDRRTEFEDLASVAKTNRTGMWGVCNPVTCE